MNKSLTIVVEDELTYESLYLLANQKILAIRIPQYYPTQLCDIYSCAINEFLKQQSQTVGDNIYKTISASFWEVTHKPELYESYFSDAIKNIRKIRDISHNISPTDLLRLQLDEIWPAGAGLLRINKKPMFFGIVRSWKRGALPHLDDIRSEVPAVPETAGEIAQFGVNVYLDVPQTGGEIVLWDHTFSDLESRSLGIDGNYGYKLEMLPNEALTVRPERGDLIIINSKKIHAVNDSVEGDRLTISGFIGYWGNDKPLHLWS